jgi:hypothetical protein
MKIGLEFRNELSGVPGGFWIVEQFDRIIARIGGVWQIEHTDNGSHRFRSGDWTPIIGGATSETGQAYTRQSGRITRIGSQVMGFADVILSTKGTIVGNLRIKGLPFAVPSTVTAKGANACLFSGLNTNWVQVLVTPASGTTSLSVLGNTAAATSNLTPLTTADVSNTARFIFSFSYEVSA